MGTRIDMTGRRYGRLVVLEYAGHNSGNNSLWRCKCDCGNEVTTTGTCLRMGYTKSCGCYARERAIEVNRGRAKKERKEKEENKTIPIDILMKRPVNKEKFDDWWMFGDKETLNQRWFKKYIV